MTIYRVKASDKAEVVKKLKKEDPDIVKLTDMWFDAQMAYYKMMAQEGKNVMKVSRRLYGAADKKLKELSKDKEKNKEKIQQVLRLRKWSYDLTMSIKKEISY